MFIPSIAWAHIWKYFYTQNRLNQDACKDIPTPFTGEFDKILRLIFEVIDSEVIRLSNNYIIKFKKKIKFLNSWYFVLYLHLSTKHNRNTRNIKHINVFVTFLPQYEIKTIFYCLTCHLRQCPSISLWNAHSPMLRFFCFSCLH